MVRKKNIFKILFMTLSIVFIFYGAYRGESNTVMSKAIRICLECVGIG